MSEKDSQYEGREKAFMDVDRMINEGLAGGLVHRAGKNQNIEEAQDLTNEAPPNQN
jgi:hypothetical protein